LNESQRGRKRRQGEQKGEEELASSLEPKMRRIVGDDKNVTQPGDRSRRKSQAGRPQHPILISKRMRERKVDRQGENIVCGLIPTKGKSLNLS